MADQDTASFEHLGDIPIPEKPDMQRQAMKTQVEHKLMKEDVEKEVRQETGAVPEKKGTLSPDMPKALFSIAAGFVECPKMNLDEDQAKIYADSLNVLFPVEGKIVALLNIIIITAGKVVTCWDAIKKKFAPAPQPAQAQTPTRAYRPEMDNPSDQEKKDGAK